MQEDFTEVVEITNDTHGTFDVIVPLGMEDNDIKERLKSLDLNTLLGIPEDKKKELGKTDWGKIQEWENSSYAGLRNDRWFSHDVSASETSIAYGHKLTADELSSGIININGKDVNWKKGLTRQQGNDLLIQDAEWAQQIALASLIKADLHTNPNAVASLTSVIYNVGSGNWGKSEAKKALEAGHIEDFMHEAFDAEEGFVKVNGKVSRGLVRRRREEAQLFSEGYEDKPESFKNKISEVVAALNPVSTAQASTLKPEDKMFVPPQSSDIYTVVSGDTLSQIAKDNNTTVSALQELNPQIKDVNKIGIGDKINLNTQQPEESSLLSKFNPIGSAQANIPSFKKATTVSIKDLKSNNIPNPVIPHDPIQILNLNNKAYETQDGTSIYGADIQGAFGGKDENLNYDLPKMMMWGALTAMGFDVEIDNSDLDPRTLAAGSEALGSKRSIKNYNQFSSAIAKEQVKVYNADPNMITQYAIAAFNLLKAPGKLYDYMKDNKATAAFVLGRVNIDEKGNAVNERWNWNYQNKMAGAATPFTAGRAFLGTFMPKSGEGPVMNINLFDFDEGKDSK